jgi:hypothetical protein
MEGEWSFIKISENILNYTLQGSLLTVLEFEIIQFKKHFLTFSEETIYDRSCSSNMIAWSFCDRSKKSNLISSIAFYHLIFNINHVLNMPKEPQTIKDCILPFQWSNHFRKHSKADEIQRSWAATGLRIQSCIFFLQKEKLLGWQEHYKQPALSHYQVWPVQRELVIDKGI